MQITPRFYVTQIRNAAHTIGVPLPPTLTKQLEQADALVHAAETMLGTSGDLNSAILDAIEAGRDYHNDPAVQRTALDRMIANFQSHGVTEAAHARAMQRRRDALTEHADDILQAWADAVEPHSAALAAAAAGLPTHDLADTATIIAAGLDAVQHWNDAQHAIKAWDAAASGFAAFAAAARVNTDNQRHLLFTDADTATVRPALTTARQADAWTLARHGIPLDLATLNTFTARVAAHQDEDQDVGVVYE